MYSQTANARVPTIRVADAITKTRRLNRLGRRIGQISADELDFMIRTKRAKNEYNGGSPIVYKVASMFKPSGDMPCLWGRGRLLTYWERWWESGEEVSDKL
jgi:hypothetical protein